jgi:biotin carboxyl carrier protein
MKTFNEIESEITGTLEKILAANGSSIEMGQPLFLVRE